MKHLILTLTVAALLSPALPAQLDAGRIARECVKSDRKAANRRLCNCIEKAARGTLKKSDHQLASSFFKNPHRSQEIRQSDRSSHESFWKRYKEFGARAQQMCS
ncbi:hypothetical protein [Planktotalea sp.]|uniref:hypothetical protein n=1 Tax=Planktotalea sp. TaxID=2029877 RepID=UPI00329749E4